MPSRTNAAATVVSVSVRLPFFACLRDRPSKNYLALQVFVVPESTPTVSYIHVSVEGLISEVENWSTGLMS